MQFRSLITLAVAVFATSIASAQEYSVQDLRISNPYARATAPHQPAGGAYLTIENKGKSTDKLIAASSPVAKTVEIHTMSMDGNVMKMRAVPSIEIKPAEKVEMKPGQGHHVMLMGLQQPLKAGDKFPLTLTFEKAGKTEVSVTVEDKKESGAHSMHSMH